MDCFLWLIDHTLRLTIKALVIYQLMYIVYYKETHNISHHTSDNGLEV